jgi:hypothetical protein
MSKKLLNEAAVRRFMGLAGMEANMVSNTVTEMYKNEEEEEMAETVEATTETVTEEEELKGEEDLAPVADADADPLADVEDEMMGEEAPEMEITADEADVLVGVLEKLLAARGDAGEEEADIEMADDMEVEDEEAMMETATDTVTEETETVTEEEEMNEDEIVQEVARRVAARILKAKKAQKEMNEALGK